MEERESERERESGKEGERERKRKKGGGGERKRERRGTPLQTLEIYKLAFNQNYYTLALTSLRKIVLRSKFH